MSASACPACRCCPDALAPAAPAAVDQLAAHGRSQPPAMAFALGGGRHRAGLFRSARSVGLRVRGRAGLGQGGRGAEEQVVELRRQLDELRADRAQARSIANSADSLLKAERVTQQKLADQVRALETENQAIKADLGFFERLLPTSGEPIAIRGLQVEASATGPVRYQLLVMQQGVRGQSDFRGTIEVFATGTRDAAPWSTSGPMVRQAVQFRQYRRLEGLLQPPAGVVVRQIQIRVLDESGAVKATQVHRL